MRSRGIILVLVTLIAGCGSPAASQPAAPTIASVAPSATSAPSTSAPSAPQATPVATASASPSGQATFRLCPSPSQEATCPLPPGDYVAQVHDSFSVTIADPGWQEEPAVAGEFETRVILSRIDDPSQKVTFLSGPTGPAGPVVLDPTAFQVTGFTAGIPADVKVSGTAARSIELQPSDAAAGASVTIEDQTVTLDPAKRYRITLAKIPMGEEAASFFIVTEAPVASYPPFLPLADRVLAGVKFQ
jgi:hypothetical protein